MKIVFMGLTALLLLGGGAGGAYFLLNKPAEAATTEKAEVAHAPAGHGEPVIQTSFVELEPLILPIVDERGVSQQISLVIVLEVPSAIEAAEVERLQPRLKDAYIQDMYGVLSRKAVMNGGVLEVEKIKTRLNKISQQVLGPNMVNEVLLKVVQQRRI